MRLVGTRPGIWAVLLALVLLNGASAPARADETITATGTLDGAFAGAVGAVVQSSRIEISFPAGGGSSTGIWTMVVKIEIPSFFDDGSPPCIATVTIEGPLNGAYDAASFRLEGQTTAKSISTGPGCGDPTEDTATYLWSGVHEGDTVRISIHSEDGDWPFTAIVTPGEEPGAQEPPGSEGEGETPADEPPGIADVLLGGTKTSDILRRGIDLVDCPNYDGDEPELFCKSAQDGIRAANQFHAGFIDEFADPSESERGLAKQIEIAIYMAGLTGKDGLPLFPSIGPSLQLIGKLADRGTVIPRTGEDNVSLVQRYLELLAAQDAAAWENRFK